MLESFLALKWHSIWKIFCELRSFKNYNQAEFFLRKAVELLPSDPIINDHYADTLWMLNKNIQARYFWKNILNLKDTEEELKDNIRKKLVFGISNKL